MKHQKVILCVVASVFVSLLFSSLLFTNSESEFHVSVSYKSSGRGRSANAPLITYFLLDGFNYEVFYEQLKAGNLPNMQRLIDTGGWVKQGLTTFPSITAYAFFPMLTGESSPKSDVFGLRWFNRNRTEDNFRLYIGTGYKNMNPDLTDDYKLLFEEFEEDYTYSVNTYLNRGIDEDRKTPWYMTTAKFGPYIWYFRFFKLFGGFGYQDWKGFESNVMYGLIEDAVKNRPKVQWVTLASPDGANHVTGLNDDYVDIVKHCDFLIGEFLKFTEMDGSLSERLLVVTSDHGVVTVKDNLDMIRVFDGMGLSAYEPPSCSISPIEFTTDVTWFSKKNFDVLIGINGNNQIYVYFARPDMRDKPGEEWQHRLLPEQLIHYTLPSGKIINIFEELKCTVGVEFIMALSSHTNDKFILEEGDIVAEIQSCHSSAIVHRRGDTWAYAVLTSSDGHSDPFGLLTDPDVSQKIRTAIENVEYLTRFEWLKGTIDGQFPLAPVLVEEIVSRPLCGDLIMTTKDGYDFGKDYEWFLDNNRGGHGGIHRRQTVIPMIFNGWGITPGSQVDFATSSDLGATIRHIAGLPHQSHAAGRILEELVDEKLVSENFHWSQ